MSYDIAVVIAERVKSFVERGGELGTRIQEIQMELSKESPERSSELFVELYRLIQVEVQEEQQKDYSTTKRFIFQEEDGSSKVFYRKYFSDLYFLEIQGCAPCHWSGPQPVDMKTIIRDRMKEYGSVMDERRLSKLRALRRKMFKRKQKRRLSPHFFGPMNVDCETVSYGSSRKYFLVFKDVDVTRREYFRDHGSKQWFQSI